MASDNGHVTQSPREPVTAGRAGSLAARVRAAARRPVLWGASCGGDLALAAVVTIAAVVVAVKGYLYVPHVPNASLTIVLPNLPHPLHPRPRPQPAGTLALIGIVLTTAPLAFRRTYPASAFGVMLVAFIATTSYSTGITVAAVIVAAYCAVTYSKYRRMTLLGLLAGAIVITLAYPEATAQVPARYTPLLVLLPTVALGNMMRMWRQRASESAERLRLAQAAHEAETRRAVETERARIASELHDVVTHNVSVMVVQAGAARRVLDSSPDDAREALLAIEASGRTAMTELRHLLGLLAPTEPAAASGEPGADGEVRESGPVGTDDGVLRPQPSLGNVPALADRVRAAGMPVQLSVTGTPRDLPQGVDLAGYRVVQEALTNVIKHADQARTAIRIEYRARDLLIDVANEAPAAPGKGMGGGGGRGLLGLRERIAIYGGTLDAGPRPGGGWRVRATIPLEAAGAAENAAVPAQFHGASA
jgi:signal transduction histidine kinase